MALKTGIVRNDDDDDKKDDARKDANGGKELDKILTGLDSLASAMDSFGKRMDAMTERMDSQDKRMDSMSKKDDDDDDDEDEEEEKAKAVAADKKKRKDSEKKADEPSEREEMKENIERAMKKKEEKKGDAEEKAEEKAEDDEEEKEEKKDDKKADSTVKIAPEIQAQLDALRAQLVRQPSDPDFKGFGAIQEKAHDVFVLHNDNEPRPLQGEQPLDYDVRCAEKLQKHSEKFKDTDLRKLARADAVAFATVRDFIYADAVAAADRPVTGDPSNPHRYVETQRRKTDLSGRQIIEFKANGSFIRQFKRPARHIRLNPTRLNSPSGVSGR